MDAVEGHNDVIHREGLALQIWVADAFYDDRLTLGIGLGPLIARHERRDLLTEKDGTIVAGLLSISAAYRFHPNWFVRASFNRVITDYNRDADVFFVGPGFRF